MWHGLLVTLYLHGTNREETARLFDLEDKYLGPDNIHIQEILAEAGIVNVEIWGVKNEHTHIAVCSDDIPTIVYAEQVLMEHIRNIQQQLTTFQNQRGLKLGTLRLCGKASFSPVDPRDRIKWQIQMELIPARKNRPWFNTPHELQRTNKDYTNIERFV